MSSLKAFFDEIANTEIDEDLQPDSPVSKNDHVVGKCSLEAKKLYILREIAFRQIVISQVELNQVTASIIIRHSTGTPLPREKPKEFADAEQKFCEAHRKHEILEKLFWYILNCEFPELFTKSSIGIRRGWIVVWSEKKEEEEKSDIENLFEDIEGGDLLKKLTSQLIGEIQKTQKSAEESQQN